MATLASDDFNRADATGLGANWVDRAGTIGVGDNQARQSTASALQENVSTYDGGITWPDDQFSRAVVAFTPTFGEFAGVVARATGLRGLTSDTFYMWNTTNAGVLELSKVINSSWATLTSTGQSVTSGDLIELQLEADEARGYHEGALIASVNDSAIISGQPGVFLYSVFTGTSRADDWEGGSLAAASILPFVADDMAGMRNMTDMRG